MHSISASLFAFGSAKVQISNLILDFFYDIDAMLKIANFVFGRYHLSS